MDLLKPPEIKKVDNNWNGNGSKGKEEIWVYKTHEYLMKI
jgi:hypothetical protein